MAAITDLASLAAADLSDTDLLVVHDLSAATDKKINRIDVLGPYGTWTPYINFGGNAVGLTYSSRTGNYVRVGNLVWVSADIRLSAKGSSTGTVRIDGLPYTASATAAPGIANIIWYNMASNFVFVSGAVTANDVYVLLVGYSAAAAGYTALTEAAIANNTIIQMSILYTV